MSNWKLLEGECRGGYRLGRLIGTGGYGGVFEGRLDIGKSSTDDTDDTDNIKVAIKLITPFPNNGRIQQQQLAELLAMCNIDHPNVVWAQHAQKLYDTKGILEYYLLKMELARRSLADRLKEIAAQPPLCRERVELAYKVALAVSSALHHLAVYLPSKGKKTYVHIDIKPENILEVFPPDGGDEIWKISDFGCVALLENSQSRMTALLRGTRIFSPPEGQDDSEIEIEPVWDTWSLGVTLVEILTGRLPFGADGMTDPEIKRQICEDIPNLGDVIFPSPFGSLIDGCLEKNRAKRWTSCRILAELANGCPCTSGINQNSGLLFPVRPFNGVKGKSFIPPRKRVGDVFRDISNEKFPELVVVPLLENEFLEQTDYVGNASSILAVGRDPITVGEYNAFKMAIGQIQCKRNNRLPQTDIARREMEEYIAWLNNLRLNNIQYSENMPPYRLLTSREWVLCCLAGTSTSYNLGGACDDVTPSQAIYRWSEGNKAKFKLHLRNNPSLRSVDDKSNLFNPLGLRGMHGNVFELVVVDGDGSSEARGGSFLSSPGELSAEFSKQLRKNETDCDLGFRICRELNGEEI